jgi:multisubunit Na+/H+ antiporter MnhF subunit
MESSNQIGSIDAELIRRHKVTARIVGMLLIGTALLALITLLAKNHLRQQPNPSLDIALRITILIFGLGSVALRRTKFSAMRLQDIGALRGPAGLLDTLEKTTLKVAFLGATIAVMGFVTTLLTGNEYYTYIAVFLGAIVLLYCFPTRSSWQRTLQKFAQNQESAGPPNPSVLTPQP